MGASCFGGGRVARGDAPVFIYTQPHCDLLFFLSASTSKFNIHGELTRRAANARANLQRRQGAESSPPRGTRESGAA